MLDVYHVAVAAVSHHSFNRLCDSRFGNPPLHLFACLARCVGLALELIRRDASTTLIVTDVPPVVDVAGTCAQTVS